jgi:DHA2 family multidrug resistance protein
MEVLDTSVANVALPHIAGNLGASNEESTWVLTSYLVSNAIILPLSGWLVAALGRKRFFMGSIVLFTLSSLLCGLAPNLGWLILGRVFQGVGGGGLQPMAQAILADSFHPSKRGVAFSIFSVTALIAPSVGPTLGGWITDNYSWRWVFNINLPVGLITLSLIYRLLEDPPYLRTAKAKLGRFDYVGFSLLVLGVSALQIVLDKGQEADWFSSHVIAFLAGLAVVLLVSLVIFEWRHEHPIVNVRLFKHPNFAIANVMIFVLGVLTFASTVLLPQFLQTLMGYSAESSGMVMSMANLPLLIMVPFIGKLTTKLQARAILAAGWIALASAMYFSVLQMNMLISFWHASMLRVLQYSPVLIAFVPASMAAYFGIARERSNDVAGMVNFMRNIGSSVGMAIVTTLIARRTQFHQAMLVSSISDANPTFQITSWALAQRFHHFGFNTPDSQRLALSMIYRSILNQAATLSYLDTYWVFAMGATVMFALSFLVKRNRTKGDA